MSLYRDKVDQGTLDAEDAERTDLIEKQLVTAAEAEAEYSRAMWQDDIVAARVALESSIEQTARADSLLAGWHNIWLAGCYSVGGDAESADEAYRRARRNLGVNVILPTTARRIEEEASEPVNAFASVLCGILGLTSNDSYQREMRKLRARLADLDGGTPNQMEESVRSLGESLGFEATRPDNEFGTGPDVLWLDSVQNRCVGFELKTDKRPPASYRKSDIAQAHDSVAWLANNKKDCQLLGLVVVGPDGKRTDEANPADNMWWAPADVFVDLRQQLLALIDDLRKLLPVERVARAKADSEMDHWRLDQLMRRIAKRQLKDM